MKRIISYLLVISLMLTCTMCANAEGKEYKKLNDPDLLRYVEDTVYSQLIEDLDSSEYFIENVETAYISKEYIEELEFNSQMNVFFGYTLEELNEQFIGKKYVFTLGEDGETTVEELEEYDDTYSKVIRNVAIGSGVILVCVTVSVVTAGTGAAAISVIFAASAKTATTMALSGALISGATAGIVTGIQTGDVEESLKSMALAGSEGFMMGAISGAISGGVNEAIALKGATLHGLSMNDAAAIQRESGYPLDVIKEFESVEQYNVVKKAGLTKQMIDGKSMLVRKIDLNYVDKDTNMTNLMRMQEGLAPLDSTGTAYELHHIGQKADSTLVILTKAEHMQGGNNSIWHKFGLASEAHAKGNNWNAERMKIWKEIADVMTNGGV